MKRKLTVIICTLLVLSMGIMGCSKKSTATNTASSSPQKSNSGPVTLKYMTGSSGLLLKAEQKIADNFTKANPNIKIEITSVPGTDTFVTALKTKFSAGEEPDLYSFQGGNRTIEFAKAGKLYDLTDEPFMKQAKPEDLKLNTYKGRVYGFTIDVQATGLFVNQEVLKKYPNVKIPENFNQLIDACKQLREKGLKYPMNMAGKDIGNVSQFDFQYLSTVILFNNPNYYKEMLEGKRHFNDPFIREMFDKFAKVKEYMSEDALGVDNDEAIKRFIKGDSVFWIAHGGTITRMRELGPDLDVIIVPSVLQDKTEDRVFNVGNCNSLHLVKSTKHLEEAKKFFAYYVTKESGEILVKEGKLISAVKGVEVMPDKALDPCLKWFNQERKSPHADLVWIPGIKDVMKEVTQKWFMGEKLDNILNEWESQHQRLLKTNPDFVQNYGKE